MAKVLSNLLPKTLAHVLKEPISAGLDLFTVVMISTLSEKTKIFIYDRIFLYPTVINQQLIKRLVNLEDITVPTLFKPIQFNILKKLNSGKKLNDNEKRYLRGKMKDKLHLLEELESKEETSNTINVFLNSVGSYYITGLEALKHNGYGWYFQPKVIEILNTKIEGRIRIGDKMLKLIRVKSIENSKYTVDKKTGLKYATNEQIIKDISITKNEYAKKVWIQMLSRYNDMFVKNYNKFKSLIPKQRIINYKKFGV